MKTISQIDPNFRLPDSVPKDMEFISVFQPPFSIWGTGEKNENVLCRLPLSLLPECSEGVRWLAYHLAGACVRFSTDARCLALIWTLLEKGNMPHFAASGQSGMELFEETDGGVRQIKNIIPAMEEGGCGCREKQSSYADLPGGMRHYVLYLPLYNGVSDLHLGFPAGAALLPGRTPRIQKPIVFYGSSITQGGCADKAGSAYPAILCRRLDAAQINLGFSGNAKGEPVMARYIASLPMSALVLDYDHNAPNPEHLKGTHFPFYRTVRQAQKDVPIVMVSRPDFDRNPADAQACRDIILETYAQARAAGDRNVYFVDGQTLLGDTDRDMCTVDGVHPNSLGFLRMADALEPVLRGILR